MARMSERDTAYTRVAMAKAALGSLDEAIRVLRMQRRAAQALVEQRLHEHMLALLAEKDAEAERR